jgi:hypothetical protein
MVGNHIYMGDLIHAWEEHFSTLATPVMQEHFTLDRFDRACTNVQNVRNSIIQDSPLKIPITEFEVKQAIQSLKKRKAADGYDLAAEHLQHAPGVVSEFLTPMMNKVLETGKVPPKLKEGLVHPIHKKGKPKDVAGNYRGITITPLIGKVIDKVALLHQQISTPGRDHDLQFGFTPGKSGVHAAFILNECITESRDKGEPLYVASLDVQKAFDVMRHESLLDKLSSQGLLGVWWRLKDDSYQGITGKVVWEGTQSTSPYLMKQGNRQGGLPSPDDYKTYLKDLLDMLEKTQMGCYIGDINLVSPTCADDMLVMARSMYHLQVLLQIIAAYANEEHYVIHPIKSLILPINVQSEAQLNFLEEYKPWIINGEPLPLSRELVHVGIQRDLNNVNASVDTRISNGRKTIYALLGAGMHGTNGLPVPTSIHLYNIYVLPRVTYGLEALILSKPNLKALEQFQRSTLRSLLGLPQRVAIPAMYILTGIIPMEYMIDLKCLTFLHSLISVGGRTRDLVFRQYVVKGPKSKSWITHMKLKLYKYSLPSIFDLLADTPTKAEWKVTARNAVVEVAKRDLEEEAAAKSTLTYLNADYTYKVSHNAIAVIHNPREVYRANIKIRMITGTYVLQSSRLKFGRADIGTCQLCGSGAEDITHMLLLCKSLSHIRDKYLPGIKDMVLSVCPDNQRVLYDPGLLTHLILDPSHSRIAQEMYLPADQRKRLEVITRNFCYALHLGRSRILNVKHDR